MPFLSRAFLLYFYVLENKQKGKKKKCKYTTKFEMQLHGSKIYFQIWRTMIMRHHSVKFSLMEAGHTKFHPDWHFRRP